MRVRIKFILVSICLLIAPNLGNASQIASTQAPCTRHFSNGCRLEIPLQDAKRTKDMFGSPQRKSLKSLGDFLNGHRHQEIEIGGHVYSQGNIEKDLARGDAIVNFAKRYLETQGVDARQMTLISYGAEKPMVEDARSKSNLRLVILYCNDGECADERQPLD